MKKYNIGISISRAIAVFMVLICHIANYYNISIISESFNVSVEIFLFISGYLSYNRNKDNWIKKRFKRVYLPVIIFGLFYVILSLFVNNKFDIFKFVMSISGLCGIKYVFLDINFNGIDGLTHLWFLLIIIICYLIVPLIEKIKCKDMKKIFIFLFLIQCLLLIFHINISFFVIFIIGFLCAKFKYSYVNSYKKAFIIILPLIIRLIGRKLFDDTFFYLYLIIPLTNNLIAFFVVDIINYLVRIYKLKSNKILQFINNISFEIYIVHYVLIYGFFNIFKYKIPVTFIILIFFLITILEAYILNVINGKVIKLMNKRS